MESMQQLSIQFFTFMDFFKLHIHWFIRLRACHNSTKKDVFGNTSTSKRDYVLYEIRNKFIFRWQTEICE